MNITSKQVTINSNTAGFVECLPVDYDSRKQYGLLLHFSGRDEHNAIVEDEMKNGIPARIKAGLELPWIVICPSFISNTQEATPDQVNDVLQYILKNYPIDQNHIYMAGLSYGGGEVIGFLYKHENASLISAAIIMCPAYSSSNQVVPTFVSKDVKVWFFAYTGDPIAGGYTKGFAAQIKSAGIGAIANKATLWAGTSHDCWTKASDPAYKENGLNIYDWLAQWSKAIKATVPEIFKVVKDADGVTYNLYNNPKTWTQV